MLVTEATTGAQQTATKTREIVTKTKTAATGGAIGTIRGRHLHSSREAAAVSKASRWAAPALQLEELAAAVVAATHCPVPGQCYRPASTCAPGSRRVCSVPACPAAPSGVPARNRKTSRTRGRHLNRRLFEFCDYWDAEHDCSWAFPSLRKVGHLSYIRNTSEALPGGFLLHIKYMYIYHTWINFNNDGNKNITLAVRRIFPQIFCWFWQFSSFLADARMPTFSQIWYMYKYIYISI